MKTLKMFQEVKLLLEKNRTNDNLYLDEIRFVLYYNFLKDKIQSYFLDKRNEDAIRLMAPFLNLDTNLIQDSETEYSQTFSLPEDYFDFSNLKVLASKGECSNVDLLAHEIKSENLHLYLNDTNTEPSFFYRETFYLSSSKGITVYKKDFNISRVLLNYYRKIGEIDMKGYLKENGEQSKDIDADIPDNLVPYMVNAIVKAFSQSQGDIENYKLANNELMSGTI